MLRVGVLHWVDDKLLAGFPAGVEVVRYEARSSDPIEVEFLVAPNPQDEAEQVFPRLRGVKVIQAISAGVESLLPLIPPGVIFANARGVHNASTSEWTVTAILASLKYLPFYVEQQQQGVWASDRRVTGKYKTLLHVEDRYPVHVLVEDLYSKTVLIVGYGAIGQAIEERLAAFGVTIRRVARTPREGVSPVADLPALLPEADVVVLITPLTDETHHLIDAAALARMKQGALLVNAARGAVVDTDALVAALEAGKLRAALDVTDPEPLPPGHPLWSAPNVLITPHVAGSNPRFLPQVFRMVAEQVTRYARGEDLANVIRGPY